MTVLVAVKIARIERVSICPISPAKFDVVDGQGKSKERKMLKQRGAIRRDLAATEFLRLGGKKIPAGFAGKALAATKTLRRQMGAAQGMRNERARLFARLKDESAVAVDDPGNKKTLEQIASLHRKLAAKKLRFPKVRGEVGWISPGTVSGTIAPPFDFADTIPAVISGNTELSASANVDGQIGASAATAETGFDNNGSEYARVGFFFHPMSQGTLTVAASPAYSFEWSTNSLNSTPVTSSGDVGLTIYGMNELAQILSTAGSTYTSWQQNTTGIQFNFGFDLQNSLSVSLPVTPAQIYLCFVEVFAQAMGCGWPGSLASAMASASVPSMSFEFVPLVVANP
jgi:hypothetical protein